jgi:hypothetical protein
MSYPIRTFSLPDPIQTRSVSTDIRAEPWLPVAYAAEAFMRTSASPSVGAFRVPRGSFVHQLYLHIHYCQHVNSYPY